MVAQHIKDFFFFQAEDGIRDKLVTGVQTCALPILFSAPQFPRTAILMGHVRGVVCLAAAELEIDVSALPPAAVKQAITGSGAASKTQIQAAVSRLLHPGDALDSHVSDAIAISLTALSRRGFPLQRANQEVAP